MPQTRAKFNARFEQFKLLKKDYEVSCPSSYIPILL
jgi:hypothetical protein